MEPPKKNQGKFGVEIGYTVLALAFLARPYSDLFITYGLNYILGVGILFYALTKIKKNDLLKKPVIYTLFFILTATVGAVINGSFPQMFTRQLGLIMLGPALMIISYKTFEGDLNRILKLIVTTSIPAYIYSFTQWMMGNGVLEDALNANRLNGGFIEPNTLAVYTLIILLSSLYLYNENKNKKYLLWSAISIFILTHTYSRAIWVLAVIMMGTYLLPQKKTKIYMGLTVLMILLITSNSDAIKRLGTLGIEDGGITARILRWSFYLDEISDNPVLGGGFGYSEKLYYKITMQSARQLKSSHPHNDYLRAAVDGGIMATIFLIMIYTANLKKSCEYMGSKKYFTLSLTLGFMALMIIYEVYLKSSFIYFYWPIIACLWSEKK